MIAILDEDDVLIGFKQVAKPHKGAVEVPPKCDLATDGRYRWNRKAERFDPIPAVLVRIGETSTFNKLVTQHLLGLLPRDQVTREIQDSADFILESDPEHVEKLLRKFRQQKRVR